MNKRLADLVQLESNTKDCAVFTVKPETSPMDLVKLGGFEGHECMFRMSKDPNTTCITVFRDGDEPYHMNYGSSTTLVSEDRRKVRSLIMECVSLDFGIFTSGEWHGAHGFDEMVKATTGHRDLDSGRMFEIQRSGNDCSLFVNHQHIGHIRHDQLDEWVAERNIKMDVQQTRGFAPNRTSIGIFTRAHAPERADLAQAEPHVEPGAFGEVLDKALDSFLGKTGWQGLDAPSIVVEFVRFAKQDMEPSLDDLKNEAKEKARTRNAERADQAKSRKDRDPER